MRKETSILVFLLTLVTAVSLVGQPSHDRMKDMFGMPAFVFETAQFPGDENGKTKLEIKIGLVNDVLQFVKLDKKERYRAGYELTIDIVNSENSQIDGKVINREVFAQNFHETNSRKRLNTESLTFSLIPGQYSIHLDILDLDTRKHLQRNENIKVRAFDGKEPRISSLIFMENRDEGENTLEQNIARVFVHQNKEIFVRFALSGFALSDSIAINYEIQDWDQHKVSAWQEKIAAERQSLILTRNLTDRLTVTGQVTLKITCVQKDKTVDAKQNLVLKVLPGQQVEDNSILPGSVSWKPLRYIMNNDAYKELAHADSVMRDNLISEFWVERDPTPGTDENELKTEFDERVHFANSHFAVIVDHRQGWETDRGEVYIRNGRPDFVRNQPTKLGEQAIEIWVYQQLGKQYVFRDKNGNGNYVLVQQE